MQGDGVPSRHTPPRACVHVYAVLLRAVTYKLNETRNVNYSITVGTRAAAARAIYDADERASERVIEASASY